MSELDKKKVAVKSFSFNTWLQLKDRKPIESEFLENEILTYQVIHNYEKNDSKKCDYLVEYLGFILYDDNHPDIGAIVNSWCSHGNLSNYSKFISNQVKFFEIEKSWKNKDSTYQNEIVELLNMALQIAKAMHYLNNTLKIIHRDLKGNNVFLEMRNDGKLITKVGDFGTCLNETNKSWINHPSYYGTEGFMVSFWGVPPFYVQRRLQGGTPLLIFLFHTH